MQIIGPAPRRNPTPLPEPAADALIVAEFAHLRGPYLDVAARGPLPTSALHAAEAVLRAQAEGVVPKAEWLALVETVRAQAAALIGAAPEEVAFTRNVSDGLNIVGAGLRLGRGERVVIAPAAEHPNNVFPWLWQARTRGADLVQVTPLPGEALEAAIIRHIDAATRLVAVTAVDFATGRRTDLAAIGAACRDRGAFLLVDAAQSAGVLAHDMAVLPVDGWACAVQKGLLGPYGLGLLYLRRAWVDRILPVALARFSVELAAGHEAAGPEDGWRLRPGAGRFEIGNYNYIAIAALGASLDLLARIGPEAVERRALAAAARLRAALDRLGLPMLEVPPAHRSHILAIAAQQGSGHDRSEVPWVNALSASLTRAGVAHSLRRGALRLSTHFHLFPTALELAIAGIEAWSRQAGGGFDAATR